jgi:regulation of enolase protein 1 (concanavalin A-like superfamily)
MHEIDVVYPVPASCPAPRWFCEPRTWRADAASRTLRIEPDAGTDFWQKTHYDFRVDNGHFLFTEIDRDFTLGAHVRFDPVHQYDQAGLMVRLSPTCWLKTSVEFEPGAPSRLGSVVTNAGFSDWSTQEFPPGLREVWLRIRRTGGDYLVEAAREPDAFSQIRLAHLAEDDGNRPIRVGPYACSPRGSGYVAELDAIELSAH